MSPPVAPGLAVTLYPGDSMRVVEAQRALLTRVRPAIVQLHTEPGPKSAAVADALRAMLPGVRVWWGIPGNKLVRDNGPAVVRKIVRAARELGAEAVVLNCESPSKPGLPGWTPATTPALTPAQLEARMAAVVKAAGEELGPSMRLGFTSHDRASHKIPWGAALGAASPVTFHLPQQYASPGRSKGEESIPALASWKAARARAEKSDASFAELVAKGTIRADLGPGGAGYFVYSQIHDVTTAGVCLLLDRTAVACAWSLDSRPRTTPRASFPDYDEAGARALEVMGAIHREVGASPGAVARWQALHGLEADGVFGAKSEAALGL